MTTYGSLFSGVGGFDLGCDAAGWECKWQVEVDAKCRNVLAHHWPDVNRYEDVRNVVGGVGLLQPDRESGSSALAEVEHRASDGVGVHLLEPVDVITYGFPCQDLSVAGKRAGLDGDRSGLFFEAIRIIDEMRKATDGAYPRVAVAENVLGLLNADKGDAMGRCLDALAEVGALAIEWRVLDAQFFGVPQRRRRVFLVAVFDPRAAGRGQVFPESEGMPGDPPKSRTPGPTLAGSLTGSLGSGGPDAAHALNGWMVPGVQAGAYESGPGFWTASEVAGTLRADPDGSTRGQVIYPASANDATGGSSSVNDALGGGHRTQQSRDIPHPELANSVTAKWAKGTGGPAGDECQNLVLDLAP